MDSKTNLNGPPCLLIDNFQITMEEIHLNSPDHSTYLRNVIMGAYSGGKGAEKLEELLHWFEPSFPFLLSILLFLPSFRGSWGVNPLFVNAGILKGNPNLPAVVRWLCLLGRRNWR